jgi:hypothetical protein
MGRFYNNRGMLVNILTGTNTANNRRTARFYATVGKRLTLRTRKQHKKKLLFICGPRQENARNKRMSIARQQSCKRAFLTVTLRVVGGDEKGSLKSETVKYGYESKGARIQETLRWRVPAACTKDRPVLSSERTPTETGP